MSRRPGLRRWGDDGGAVVAMLAIVLLVVAMVTVSIVATATGSVRVAKAQWSADATALAVAAEGLSPRGISSGRAVAAANGANLLTVSIQVDSSGRGPSDPASGAGELPNATMSTIVVVEVERDGVQATAAAARIFPVDR